MPDISPMQQQALQAEIARLSADGWTVTSVTGNQAILQRKKRIGWFWNLVLSVITGGLWLIVVIIRLVNRKTLTRVVSVDPSGVIIRR
ncbi:hypothetical protein [Curtobacterium flaccumfaciens]|uniref:hypothetical protein n=1 Tax=Curtobacterium flaccumfaciens TaxID=2035 RepID=UPI003995BA3B